MKPNENFLTSSSPPDDVRGLMEFIRPRSPKEILELFAPAPPSLDAPEETLPMRRTENELGLTAEEFAELALQEPDLWDESELDRLYMLAAGEKVDVEDLMSSFSSRDRRKKLPAPVLVSSTPEIEEETVPQYDLPSELEVRDLGIQPAIPDLDQLKDLKDVGGWYKKRP